MLKTWRRRLFASADWKFVGSWDVTPFNVEGTRRVHKPR